MSSWLSHGGVRLARTIPVVVLLAAAVSEMQVVMQEQMLNLVCDEHHALGQNISCKADEIVDESNTWAQNTQIAFGVASLITTSSFGTISDRYGRKLIMLISVVGNLLVAVSAALVGALHIGQWRIFLTVANALSGLCGGTTITLMGIFGYLADGCPPIERTEKFPIVEATYAVGGFIAYLCGGYLSDIYGETTTLWVIVGVLIVLTVYIVSLPEAPMKHKKESKLSWKSLHSMRAIWTFCFKPLDQNVQTGSFVPQTSRIALAGTFFFSFLAFLGGFNVTTLIFKTSRYGWNDTEVGIYNAVYTGSRASTLVLGPIIHRLGLSFKSKRLFVQVLLIIFGVCTICTSFTTSVAIASVLAGVAGLTVPISFGYLRAMATNSVDPSMQGEALGALAYLESLDSLLAPVIFNSLLAVHNLGPAGALPFWTIGALSIQSGIVLYFMRAQPVKKQILEALVIGHDDDDAPGYVEDYESSRPLLSTSHDTNTGDTSTKIND